MKYHWIGFNQDDESKNIVLKIPEQIQALGTKNINNTVVNNEEDFQPQLIQTDRSSSLVVNMTKTQIKDSCSQLLTRTIADENLFQLAVGDCVISNYQDPIIEVRLEEGTMKSTKSRQAQIRKVGILKACHQSVNLKKYNNEIEKQLLLGVCVSGKAK